MHKRPELLILTTKYLRNIKSILRFSKSRSFYNIFYFFLKFKFSDRDKNSNKLNYYTLIPNSGAGIGHQIGNWNAGYWHSKQFNLNFVHSPFSKGNWESFLGFGESESDLNELLVKGYKTVHLPLFNEFNEFEVMMQKIIIRSFYNKKVVFIAKQDQGYKNQIGVMKDLKLKFKNAEARKNDNLNFVKSKFNIAVHIRRGDIVLGQKNRNPNLLKRWLDNLYFVNILCQVLENLKIERKIAIYLFSEGLEDDFPEFNQFPNLQLCLNWSDQDSFLHMVMADLLITSKSSFSYNAALLSDGILVCPKDFWHGYPQTDNWIFCDNNGILDHKKFKNQFF